MTVRQKLIGIASLLIVSTMGLAGVVAVEAWGKYRLANQAQSSIVNVNAFSQAVEEIAIESSVIFGLLNATTVATDAQLAPALEAQEKATQLITTTVDQLAQTNPSDRLTGGLNNLQEKLVALEAARQAAYDTVKQSAFFRTPAALKGWLPATLDVIYAANNLALIILDENVTQETGLSNWIYIFRNANILLSNFTTESSRIAGSLASSSYFSPDITGDVQSANALYNIAVYKMSEETETMTDQDMASVLMAAGGILEASYFETRNAVVEVGMNGGDYPVTIDAWFALEKQLIIELYDWKIALVGQLEQELTDLTNASLRELLFSLSLILAALFMGAITHRVIQRGVIYPISSLTHSLEQIADGDLETSIDFTDAKTEFGIMSQSISYLRDRAVEAKELELKNQLEAQKDKERSDEIRELSDTFVSKIGLVLEKVVTVCETLNASAQDLKTASKNAENSAQIVHQTYQTSSENIKSVASATQELASSIQEISGITTSSLDAVNKTQDEANQMQSSVKELAVATTTIDDIVSLIDSIAGETNLLALNATIEAARAGDAGKGFAVVAGEVKNLAAQTGGATAQITDKVRTLQNLSTESSEAFTKIGKTLKSSGEFTVSIASSVEQQDAATCEIARNMEEALQSIIHTETELDALAKTSEQNNESADNVLSVSVNLNEKMQDLKQIVTEYVANVQTVLNA